MATQQQLALQMIGQLRVLDPSVSAEIGTPERKIIDTVAQALAENQIDLNQFNGSFDLESKFGTDLDKFLAIFGFGRQQGTTATGFITLTRAATSNYDIPIPTGTQFAAPAIDTGSGGTIRVLFQTTQTVTLTAGTLKVAAPIACITTGTIGNVAANTITTFGRSAILGIPEDGITNELPTNGGLDIESDDEYKTRFKNTVFRNVSGTTDQYLALAISTAYTTKANVVGPISRYREYIQVPDVDDATVDPSNGVSGNGGAGVWTTAVSSVPYSKHTYDTVPFFVSNGSNGTDAFFLREGVDFDMNTANALKDRGDTYRDRITGEGPNVNTDPTTTYQPNISFLSVFKPDTDTEQTDLVQAARPGDIMLFEHSYMSSASRNDYDRSVLNCVDVFINGENPTQADVVIPTPRGTRGMFNSISGDRYYIENYRRVGESNQRPVLGNLYTPVYFQPMIDLPDTIVASDATYLKNVHYWAVEDVTEIGNTVRARNGIEWATTINGMGTSDSEAGPYTGPKVIATADAVLAISGYTYDRNVADLQVACEGSKQVTTDVLAHRATKRHFKLDLTVMYTAGSSSAAVNQAIYTAVQNFFEGLYFGTVVQLSDILQTVHEVNGVDNVRWSRDAVERLALHTIDVSSDPAWAGTSLADALLTDAAQNTRDRVIECDDNGKPILNVVIDRRQIGTVSTPEIQQAYITGNPVGGTYDLNVFGVTYSAIPYNAAFGLLQSHLSTVANVTGSGTAADPFIFTATANGAKALSTATPHFLGADTVFNSDFFLKDDELPTLPTGTQTGDTLPGLIIRPRAQNTWDQV